MATINIPAWDIAEKLGLVFVGEEWDENFAMYVHKYRFHGKEIVDDMWYESDAEAKESIAEDLLMKLGKHLAGIID